VLKFIGLPTPASFYKKFLLSIKPGEDIKPPKSVKMEFF
jgi:hypothetical protein